MTFDSQERSVQDGEPIQLYKFEGPTALYEYFYTAFPRDVVYDGDTYVSVPLLDTAVATTGNLDFPEVSVDVPVSSQLAIDYAFGIQPASLKLTIFRMQSFGGPVIQWWEGVIDSLNVEGGFAKFRLAFRLDDSLSTSIPRPIYQRQCNHKLYDTKCTIIATNFDFATTISTVDGKTITVASVDSNPDQFYRHGEVVRAADGERRLIVDQQGTTLILSLAFKVLASPDAVTLFAGCDHSVVTCRDKFSNVANYGGQPYIPSKDIFRVGLKGI